VISYPDSVEFLYALGNETKAFKLGLAPIKSLLRELDNPQSAFGSVHVAGTNGKGSTCAMIESGLRETKIRTGLYTSPHLVRPSERIQIGGVPITPESFASAFATVHSAAESLIARGELSEGAQLPPVRQVAADLGVNMNTIATAYRELQDDGLIVVKHGSGAVVTSRWTNGASQDEMRQSLRGALTQMVLSGMKKTEIMSFVADELRGLLKGAK